jgi:NAD+ synthase (glutamine-hydrolysing)
MTPFLRIVKAQLNFHVGNLEANLKKHQLAIETAATQFKADIIVFPELSLTGYPPEDLLLRPKFLTDAQEALLALAQSVPDIYCLVGHPYLENNHLYNTCSILQDGKILKHYYKQNLPLMNAVILHLANLLVFLK